MHVQVVLFHLIWAMYLRFWLARKLSGVESIVHEAVDNLRFDVHVYHLDPKSSRRVKPRGMSRPVAKQLGLPATGWAEGVCYSSSKGTELKMSVRRYVDSSDRDTHTSVRIGDFEIAEDDERNLDFAERTPGEGLGQGLLG